MGIISENVRRITESLPSDVALMAVVKTRTAEEVLEAVEAGFRIHGGNYVQETAALAGRVAQEVKWHMIGHLQTNKVKKAVGIFDMIETVDSVELTREIDKRCAQAGGTMDVLVEINSGREPNKTGVTPEDAEALVRTIAQLSHIRLRGLMTMGPLFGDPEASRPYFRETKRLFDRLDSLGIPGVRMDILSMGMSHSYTVAIEESATLVRIGTKIFGERIG